MNVLLITHGSRGDIHPFIGLGVALKKQGQKVTVISIDLYESLVLAAGLHFISCGTNEDYYTGIHHPDAYSLNQKKTFQLIADYLIFSTMRSVYQIVCDFDPKKTILVASHMMYGARLAHEKLNFPLLTVCLQPFTLWSVKQPPIGIDGVAYHWLPYGVRRCIFSMFDRFLLDKTLAKPLNLFRQSLELAPVQQIYSRWSYSPQKVIGLFPSWFATPAKDWPPNTELASFIQYDEAPNEALPPDALAFLAAGDKPILLTYGTAVTQSDDFFIHGLEAARTLGLRCIILSVHQAHVPVLQTHTELYISYVPLQKILPHCAVILHAGGIGTIAQALAAGIPQLIVPFLNDQPDNAFRLAKLGVALNIPSYQWNKVKAIAGIRKLLTDPKIKFNCEQYAKKIDFAQAEEKVCALIKKMLSELSTNQCRTADLMTD